MAIYFKELKLCNIDVIILTISIPSTLNKINYFKFFLNELFLVKFLTSSSDIFSSEN